MGLALAAALGTLLLKFAAYWTTGSVVAIIALEVASRPADATHAYGHEKAEYFSSGVEGALIVAAAAGISYQAWNRLQNPLPLEALPLGLVISIIAALINFAVARALLTAARDSESITLEAHAKHLLTDVWTTVGVVVGLGAVLVTGWTWLDPLIALLVALNIVRAGVELLQRSTRGLMDTALSAEELRTIERILQKYTEDGQATYHRLRTRRAGPKRFIDFHLLVPGSRTVKETHDLCERIESEIQNALREASITIHVEPLEDPASWKGEDARASTP